MKLNLKLLNNRTLLTVLVLAIPAYGILANASEDDGAVDIPAFRLPLSDYLSDTTKEVLISGKGLFSYAGVDGKCAPSNNPIEVPIDKLPAWRDCRAKAFKESTMYRDLISRYSDVVVKEAHIAGIRNEIFTPKAGVAPENEHRVLIQLHGGGEIHGSRWSTHLSSVPVSSIGRYKIVAVDYPLYPEASHRERTSSFMSVYKALLKDYWPENIGVYGCSAGGIMTSQMIPSLLREGLPVPGAVGIFGADGSVVTTVGDSLYWGGASSGVSGEEIERKVNQRRRGAISPVYEGFSPEDPRVNPLKSPEILKQFPPSLLLYGLRDFNISGGVALHSALVKQGVEADLHIWEGMGHCFQVHPNTLESEDANKVIAKFFDKRLGQKPR